MPLWSDYRELAASAGLGACWSTPIFATDGALLGTFALYYRDARDASANDVQLVELATHVAGIAIERARSEEAARASDDRYRDLFENAYEPIGTVTLDEQIVEVNKAFERVLGYSRDELIGAKLTDYLTPDGIEASRRATASRLSGDESETTFEQEFLAKDGHTVILEVSSRVIEEHGRPVGIQGICRDITARKQAELALHRLSELNRQQALHDSLTGLPNRANFSQQVEHAIGVAEHDGSQLAVLLMDLDRFKEVNDTLGHRYGDLLLVELATAPRVGRPPQRHRGTPRRRRVRDPRAPARRLAGRPRRDARPHAGGTRPPVPGRRPAAPHRGRASASLATRRTAATSTCCSSAPTSRCIRPSRPAGRAPNTRPSSTSTTRRA